MGTVIIWNGRYSLNLFTGWNKEMMKNWQQIIFFFKSSKRNDKLWEKSHMKKAWLGRIAVDKYNKTF